MTQKTALLFDLDGTLIDTLRDLGECVNEVLALHGYPTHPLYKYRYFVGDGARKLIERALGDAATPARTDALFAEFVPLYDRECMRYATVYAGVLETLTQLKNQGVKMAVVTNKPEIQARKLVDHLFPAGTFDVVYGNVANRPTKPDQTVVNLTLKMLKVTPDRVLFVGDSDVDVHTAKNAGIPCIGCCWGFRGEQELTDAGAAFLAHHPLDILPLFRQFVSTL